MKNVLFVCSQNKLRSPTAEQVFASHPAIETSSAGTNHDAENPLTGELIEWADLIFVMERAHRNKLQKRFRSSLNGKRIVVLHIPDEYAFMEPGLSAPSRRSLTTPWSARPLGPFAARTRGPRRQGSTMAGCEGAIGEESGWPISRHWRASH